MANKETDIHNAVLVALSQRFHPHGVFWRQNAGKVKTATGAFVSLGPPGISDIVGLLDGRAVFIEVKTDSGQQRTAQAAFQKAIEKAGGLYIIARSPEEAIDQLDKALYPSAHERLAARARAPR
ncbi:MAG: VRR-NUC domain-containing protein [Paracoccus sp.]|nr:VRR-NUC domain-containing protein [Paracoccus sp. (in: a-proteobacteria)]